MVCSAAMAVLTGSLAVDLLLLFATTSYLAYKYATRNFDYWKKRGVPFAKPVPFFGSFSECFTLKKLMAAKFADLYEATDEPFLGVFMLDKPGLLIKSPELVRSVLVKDFNHFNDRTVLCNKEADPSCAHFLFVSKNPVWKEVRAKVTPIFTSGKLKAMLPLILEVGEEMNRYIKKVAGECVEAKEVTTRYSTDVISSCMFGINAHSLTSDHSEFREAGRKFFDFRYITAMRIMTNWFAHGFARLFNIKMFDPEAVAFLTGAFETTINQRETNNFKRNDLVDIIIELRKQHDDLNGYNLGEYHDEPRHDGKTFSADGVGAVSQALQFFLAGFETSGSTVAFALYELATNPTVQELLRADVKSTLKKHGSFSYEALQDMKYLEKCLSETLRKYPTLPFLDRTCITDYRIPGTDVVIEKGTPVYVPMMGLHYDEKFFPDPHKFDPERWSDENKTRIPSYAFIPFGAGPRVCIGEKWSACATIR